MDNVVRLEPEAASERKINKTSVEALHNLVADDLHAVNSIIIKKTESPVLLISELAAHIVAAGGKRLRPMLTLGSARLCGYTGNHHIDLAACIEFIHTATLLHDDVVDDSALRRGTATANAVWGNKPSVLVGDFLFSRAFQLSVAYGSLKVLDVLANTSARLAEGEVMQLITSNDTETSEAAYLDVITAKTATLFSAACRLGAIVAERPTVEEDALSNFGLNLGIAYQLIDDALDYVGREAEFGKALGDDFREGKITLPIILAFSRGNESERVFWRRTMERGEQKEGDLSKAMILLKRHNAVTDTIDRAGHYGAMARDTLGLFRSGAEKDAFIDIISFCVERAH